MTGDVTVAYMAGIVDADGFISAHRRRNRGVIYTCPLIGIAGTNDEPHRIAQRFWGGSFFTYQPKNPDHRLQFQWQCVGIAAVRDITEMQPFLRVKREQAALALEMWDLIQRVGNRTDPWLGVAADNLRILNFRNPPKKRKAPIPPDLLVREFPA